VPKPEKALVEVKPLPTLTNDRLPLKEALERHRAACLESIRDVQSEYDTKLDERIKAMEKNETERKKQEE